jgi:hypothetical protein
MPQSKSTIHRIYTEGKNKASIIRRVAEIFESFTIQTTLGYYKGRSEKSFVIEIVGAEPRLIRKLATTIRAMNGQQSVLVITLRGSATITRGK